MRPAGTHPAPCHSARSSLFSPRGAGGAFHAARCMWLRSALRLALQCTASTTAARCVFRGKMLRGFSRHEGALCSRRSAAIPRSGRSQMHHLPFLHKTALGHPRELLRTTSCLQRTYRKTHLAPCPAVQQPSAYSKPSSCLRSWGGGKRASYGAGIYPYASGSATSAASGCSSEKSVTPFSTSRSYHWMSFLISEICTRSRS